MLKLAKLGWTSSLVYAANAGFFAVASFMFPELNVQPWAPTVAIASQRMISLDINWISRWLDTGINHGR
jgi:hypothetical protein